MAFSAFGGQQIYEALKKGIFAVNKPYNITSNETLERLKSILRKDIPEQFRPPLRVGHGGTLDHTATGVLAIGFGWGCKWLPSLLHGEKKYVVTGCLGTATDTHNEIGQIIQEARYDHISKDMFEERLKKYIGLIQQTPPKYSAIKIHGVRCSDLVREGKEVIMKPRSVVCHSIKCMKFSPPFFQLEIECGGGFYVRSLIHDIGQDLNSCAHVRSLYRSKHGPFTEEDMLDSSNWTGLNIIDAICETMNKYRSVLKRERRKESRNYRSA